MKPLNAIIAICVMVVAFAATSCGSQNTDSNVPTDPKDNLANNVEDPAPASNSCTADADCMPAECCHAKECVAMANGPENCADMMCTEECREGTMDCGAGKCACIEGECGVKWKE